MWDRRGNHKKFFCSGDLFLWDLRPLGKPPAETPLHCNPKRDQRSAPPALRPLHESPLVSRGSTCPFASYRELSDSNDPKCHVYSCGGLCVDTHESASCMVGLYDTAELSFMHVLTGVPAQDILFDPQLPHADCLIPKPRFSERKTLPLFPDEDLMKDALHFQLSLLSASPCNGTIVLV
jgi:hypothetical protein